MEVRGVTVRIERFEAAVTALEHGVLRPVRRVPAGQGRTDRWVRGIQLTPWIAHGLTPPPPPRPAHR